MVEQSAISVLQERLDGLGFTFALNSEQLDLSSFEIDASIVSVPDLLFNEFVLWSGGVEVLDVQIESLMDVVCGVQFGLVVKSTKQDLVGVLDIAELLQIIEASLDSIEIVEGRSDLIFVL